MGGVTDTTTATTSAQATGPNVTVIRNGSHARLPFHSAGPRISRVSSATSPLRDAPDAADLERVHVAARREVRAAHHDRHIARARELALHDLLLRRRDELLRALDARHEDRLDAAEHAHAPHGPHVVRDRDDRH